MECLARRGDMVCKVASERLTPPSSATHGTAHTKDVRSGERSPLFADARRREHAVDVPRRLRLSDSVVQSAHTEYPRLLLPGDELEDPRLELHRQRRELAARTGHLGEMDRGDLWRWKYHSSQHRLALLIGLGSAHVRVGGWNAAIGAASAGGGREVEGTRACRTLLELSGAVLERCE